MSCTTTQPLYFTISFQMSIQTIVGLFGVAPLCTSFIADAITPYCDIGGLKGTVSIRAFDYTLYKVYIKFPSVVGSCTLCPKDNTKCPGSTNIIQYVDVSFMKSNADIFIAQLQVLLDSPGGELYQAIVTAITTFYNGQAPSNVTIPIDSIKLL
jgi:hypothetical protein